MSVRTRRHLATDSGIFLFSCLGHKVNSTYIYEHLIKLSLYT